MKLSRKAKRHLSWSLLIIGGIVVTSALIFSEGGYMTLRRERLELERLQQENSDLIRSRQQYRNQIEELKSDPEVIERLVRESDYAHPDDIIVTLPDDPPEPEK